MNCNPPGSSIYGDSFFLFVFVFLFFYGDSLGRDTQVGSHALFQGIFLTQVQCGVQSPALQVDSLPSEPPGKPHNHLYCQSLFFSVVVVMVCIILMKKECDLFHNCDLSRCTLGAWAGSQCCTPEVLAGSHLPSGYMR